MFIVIYAILLWIQNFYHRAMEISILQKQFKEQQIQIDALKQTAYFPVYRNSLRGADGLQQYDAEELVLTGDNINMQAIAQLRNLKRLRVTKGNVNFQNAVFPKLTELEIIYTNVTGNFEKVEYVTIVNSLVPTAEVYFEKIQKMPMLKSVILYYSIYYFAQGFSDSQCQMYLQAGNQQQSYSQCIVITGDYQKIIRHCIDNNIHVTEVNCYGWDVGHNWRQIEKICQ